MFLEQSNPKQNNQIASIIPDLKGPTEDENQSLLLDHQHTNDDYYRDTDVT